MELAKRCLPLHLGPGIAQKMAGKTENILKCFDRIKNRRSCHLNYSLYYLQTGLSLGHEKEVRAVVVEGLAGRRLLTGKEKQLESSLNAGCIESWYK